MVDGGWIRGRWGFISFSFLIPRNRTFSSPPAAAAEWVRISGRRIYSTPPEKRYIFRSPTLRCTSYIVLTGLVRSNVPDRAGQIRKSFVKASHRMHHIQIKCGDSTQEPGGAMESPSIPPKKKGDIPAIYILVLTNEQFSSKLSLACLLACLLLS